MSESYNDNFTNSIEVDANKSELCNIQGDSNDSYDNISTSTDFRGFEKVPIVLCQRLDITPYMNKMRYPLAPDIKAKIISNKNANNPTTTTNKLFLSCSVVLVREDLEKLKQMVKNNTLNDYNCVKCKICDKSYSNLKKLQNHKENKHMIIYKAHKTPKRVSFSDQIIIHEVKEYHRCRKCPRIFEDYNTLRHHMKQKHKKRRCYVCHYCSKDFVDRTFFKLHIKLHCDSCGLLLANKKRYIEHRRFVCRIIKKYECKTCDMFFFNFMDLKDHSYDHLGTFFICDICKDQFQTKCEVAHHIMFLHTEKCNNELYLKRADGIYKCNFCKETSNQQLHIQEHVSTLPDLQNSVTTGYKDYSFCDQCLKKFTSEKDMLKHKWTHFLSTSDNSQLRNEKTETNKIELKTTYKLTEKLPIYLQPKLVLEKLKITNESQVNNHENKNPENLDNLNFKGILKKAVIDPVTKKTIISKHRCKECGKYLSSSYCLNRHLYFVHGVVNETNCTKQVKCPYCEEVFMWPSLLKKHNCIRMVQEMPFVDASSDFFHYVNVTNQDGFDTCTISDDDDYMDEVDYEIPAPIVQLTEFEHLDIVVNGGNGHLNVINNKTLDDLDCKVVLQEVPIEF